MEFKDYYKVLGVERTASEDDIKKAFRRLARKHHPDINKAADSATRMQELNEAHEVLRDKEKRAAYDAVGQGAQGGQPFRPPPGWDSGFEFSDGPRDFSEAADHSAFFEALFGAARRHAAQGGPGRGSDAVHARRGQDHHAKIVVPLEDAFHGATRAITPGQNPLPSTLSSSKATCQRPGCIAKARTATSVPTPPGSPMTVQQPAPDRSPWDRGRS
jgi:curved DNA-binding protein